MARFCENCGFELHTGSRFCAKCGAAIKAAPLNTAPLNTAPVAPPPQAVPPQAQNYTPPQAKPKAPPKSNTAPAAPKRQKSTAALKRNGRRNTLCIVLSVLLVIQVAAVALYGWPGLLVDGGLGKSDSFTLQPGQTAIETKSGAAVDFGPYNGMDGETVAIKELPADTGSIEGGTRRAYTITAGERSKFDGLITITLPYDESKTDSADEEGSVLAEYHNPETGEWELVDYTVNTENNTVVITTDHLSDYCTVTLQDAGSPYALLSKFSSKRLDDETAMAILREFEQTGQPGEVGDSLLRKFYVQFLPSYALDYIGSYDVDTGNAEAELVHEVIGWLTDVSELAAQGGGYKQAANVLEKSGYMLLGLSALSLGDTMIDAYKGNESAETVAAQAYKLSYNVGTALLDYKRITTGMVQLSMLGVIALDYSLNKFMVAADQTYKDALFNVVIAYNEEIHPWTDAEWYAKIMGLYKNRGDDPDKFNAALDGIMENYSSRYFFDNAEEQQVATNQAGLHTYTTGILPETEAAKEYCIQQYKARLGEKLQPVLADVVKKIQYDSRQSFSSNAQELRRALNAPLEFEVVEEIPDGEKSQYAGCTVMLSRPNAPMIDGWTAALDKDGRVSLDATIVGYIQAGLPTQLRLWNKGDDPNEEAPALTQEFKVTQKVTVIPLGNTGITPKWFEGSWQCVEYPDTVKHLKIPDNQTMLHTVFAYGADQTTETSFTFDPQTSSITTEYSPGAVSVAAAIYYGYVKDGKDYIHLSSYPGERIPGKEFMYFDGDVHFVRID